MIFKVADFLQMKLLEKREKRQSKSHVLPMLQVRYAKLPLFVFKCRKLASLWTTQKAKMKTYNFKQKLFSH